VFHLTTHHASAGANCGASSNELYVGGNQPIASEALARIKLLYEIERRPVARRLMCAARCGRHTRSRSVDALKPWLEASLAKVPKGCKLGEALGYSLNH
jgi:transposase